MSSDNSSSWENFLVNFMESNPSLSKKIHGFSCLEWLRCKEIYSKMKNPNSPAEIIDFGSAGSGNSIWTLCKTNDQNIYLLELQWGKYIRFYEKLSDESMIEDR